MDQRKCFQVIVPAEFVMDFPPWESVGVVRDLEDKIITGISTKWGPMSKLVCNSNNYCSWKFMAFMVLITNELLGFYKPTTMAISWGYWSAVTDTGCRFLADEVCSQWGKRM